VIENVEGLHAELHVQSLSNLGVFEQRHILIGKAKPASVGFHSFGSTVSKRGRDGEGRGVEIGFAIAGIGMAGGVAARRRLGALSWASVALALGSGAAWLVGVAASMSGTPLSRNGVRNRHSSSKPAAHSSSGAVKYSRIELLGWKY